VATESRSTIAWSGLSWTGGGSRRQAGPRNRGRPAAAVRARGREVIEARHPTTGDLITTVIEDLDAEIVP
jgi:hypothetical protein